MEQYYRKHYRSLFLFALSFTKNKEDAEDLVANAFLKAILSYKEGNFKAWICTVIRNEFLNLCKSRKRFISDTEFEIEWIESPENILKNYIQQEEKRWLYQQIYLLPAKERQILVLSTFHEMSDQDIANVLGFSVSNVRVIKHRTRQKLMQLYKKEGEQ